ncbi:MAG: tetratricopeptide repeat protein [Potamolinea sp.]
MQPYDGVKAFLFLEEETKGKADPVEATELAALLTGKGIGVCILNACQSGKQISVEEPNPPAPFPTREGGEILSSPDLLPSPVRRGVGGEVLDDSKETSLGSRLMSAGMQMVVAMGYSVTVTAAQLLMKTVYSHLFNQKSFTEALRLGRRELFNKKGRKAYFNKSIDLEDWLLPVAYSSQQVNLNLRAFSPEEEEQYWDKKASKYVFPQPTYGFVGRDLEILKIEKALLRHNVLLLQGMGGTGKTTLLNYLREWWQTTHFAEDVFYFGYDIKAWTLEQILFDIGKLVYKRFEQANFQAMNQRAQMQKLAAKLRSESYILILDNLESVTGQPLAIQNTLTQEEQDKLREFLQLLVAGKTRVIFGSRSGEEWLQETTFQTNIYPLQGLDEEARTDLAEKILKRHVAEKRIPTIREDADFKRLMKLLEGYPLAMEVVLVNLKKQSPSEILAGWQGANIPDVESKDKTKSIVKCVEYSHSNLSPDAQNLLLCLAYFSGFIDRSDLPNFAKHLQKLEPFQAYAFDKFDDAIQEAINWGLLSPMNSSSYSPLLVGEGLGERLLIIQPIFPYFLKMKLQTLDESIREALREGFKNHYLGLAGAYKQWMESKDAQERNLGIFFCDKEYENLYTALEICLEKQASISIFFCLDKYFVLISDKQKNLQLAKFVTQALEKYPPTFLEGELGYQVSMAIDRLANCYLNTKQYQLAKQFYQKTLEIYQADSRTEEREKQLWIARTYHNLGMVAQDLREFAEARSNYQQALEIYIEFGDRYSQASTYYHLGRVAEELGELEEAKANYLQDLQITVEFNDEHGLGISLRNLARFYQVTQDENLLTEIAQILGVTVEEVRQKFREGED